MTGTSFQHSPRGSMTPQRVARIFQACGGGVHEPTWFIWTDRDRH